MLGEDEAVLLQAKEPIEGKKAGEMSGKIANVYPMKLLRVR